MPKAGGSGWDEVMIVRTTDVNDKMIGLSVLYNNHLSETVNIYYRREKKIVESGKGEKNRQKAEDYISFFDYNTMSPGRTFRK